MSRQIVLDTETTGLSAEGGDRIIEIGCVELLSRKLTGNNRHYYLNPGRDSHEDALKVHGISNEFLKDKPKFVAIADELLEYLSGAEVIIHNAAFDVCFLNKELELTGRPLLRTFVGSITDTLAMAKELYPGKRNSLDALCDRLGVDNSSRTLHGALLDAELLADVYINLTRGQDALLISDESDESRVLTSNHLPSIDLRSFELPVLRASTDELAAHEEVLTHIDKASKGKTIWRSLT
jgi:DNA polymerase III subunit epsilon